MESAGNWLSQKVYQIHSQEPNRAVAIVVTKKEVKEASANVSLLGPLVKSKEFRQDLNMSGAYWFYHPETLKRCLLVQLSEVTTKDMRTGGVKTA